MNNLFKEKPHSGIDLRSQMDYQLPRINTVTFGEKTP